MDFYVYIHRRLDNNSVFYVGKGSGNRAYSGARRNKYWKNITTKHGYSVEILFTDLEEKQAFILESDLIVNFKAFGVKLSNMTDGGEGSSGRKQTKETRQKIAKSKEGFIFTESHRANISKALKGREASPTRIEKMRKSLTGKKQTEETKQKRRDSLRRSDKKRDNNVYVFFSDSDIFVGTRKDLSSFLSIPTRKLNTLFQKDYSSSAYGWSVLRLNSLLIFKENIKC